MLKNLLLLSGFSTFVVIIIIGLNVYRNLTPSTLRNTTQIKIEPITPDFDTTTLGELKRRVPVRVDLSEESTVISEESTRAQPPDETEPSISPVENPSASSSAATPSTQL